MVTAAQLGAAGAAVAITQGSLSILLPNLHDAGCCDGAGTAVRHGLAGAGAVALLSGLVVWHVAGTPAGLIAAGALVALTAGTYARHTSSSAPES